MNIKIYRSHTESLIKQNSFQQLLQQLPASLQLRAQRYQSELSSYNYVIGRLLLKQGLESFGLDNDLEKIEFQKNGKPILSGIHFNISHSDHHVICGFTKEGQIGIDLEKINPINFDDFRTIFSEKEWLSIESANDPMRTFYWFWTRKESIIKALGLTLSHLNQIELNVTIDHFIVDKKKWFLRNIDLEAGFMCAICAENEIGELKVLDVEF